MNPETQEAVGADSAAIFNRPTPGASLTAAPKSAPYEHPPEFTEAGEAAEVLFMEMTKPKQTTELVALLNEGMSAEAISRTIAFQGAANGKWTPDLMLPLARDYLLPMVVAVGERHGVKDMVYVNEDREFADRILAIKGGKREQVEPLPENEMEGLLAELAPTEDQSIGFMEGMNG